jgi:PKHD-type hydroxylase
MLLVIEHVLAPDAVSRLVDELARAAWKDGAATAGTRSVAVKQNEQLSLADPQARELGNRILAALGRNPLFVSATLAEKIYPPVFNRYQGGGHYGLHVDSALMRVPGADTTLRSDVSATLFLSDPDSYDGGELVIEGEYGAQEVKLAPGDMVLYPSNSIHRVAPVTRGSRLAAVTWIQSAVADGSARAMLFDLDQAIQSLTPRLESGGRAKDDPDIERLIQVYHNLLRRWAKP